MEKNWCYTIKEGIHEGVTLWSGRYCAVSAFVFLKHNGTWYILVNKRGKGTPDFQGMWNAPCGYLEADESAQEGCSREVYEETGLYINPDRFKLVHVETEPELCNHGNVTLRHVAVLVDEDLDPNNNIEDPENISKLEGGEVDEVSEIKWIPMKDIDNYQWAFNHRLTIKETFNKFVG